jgi:hypothetical protein
MRHSDYASLGMVQEHLFLGQHRVYQGIQRNSDTQEFRHPGIQTPINSSIGAGIQTTINSSVGAMEFRGIQTRINLWVEAIGQGIRARGRETIRDRASCE